MQRNVNRYQARRQTKGFACGALQHVFLALLLYLSGLQLLSLFPESRTYSRGSERNKGTQLRHDLRTALNWDEGGAGGAVTKHYCLPHRLGETGPGNKSTRAPVCPVQGISIAPRHRLAMYGKGSAFMYPTLLPHNPQSHTAYQPNICCAQLTERKNRTDQPPGMQHATRCTAQVTSYAIIMNMYHTFPRTPQADTTTGTQAPAAAASPRYPCGERCQLTASGQLTDRLRSLSHYDRPLSTATPALPETGTCPPCPSILFPPGNGGQHDFNTRLNVLLPCITDYQPTTRTATFLLTQPFCKNLVQPCISLVPPHLPCAPTPGPHTIRDTYLPT